jgi:transposase
VVSRRCVGLDVHREFAQVAVWEAGVVRQVGRIATTPEALRLFADSLGPEDEVALEATGNTHAIARLLERWVARVVVVNPAKKVSQYLAEGADRAAPNSVGET